MAKVKSSGTTKRSRPALTPESREKQMISLAVDLAEQQLKDGTASSQVITHYLKLASMKEKLERERLVEENKLLRAKTESIASAKNVEKLYSDAITAMKRYGGYDGDEY
jgi:hypothetical protein